MHQWPQSSSPALTSSLNSRPITPLSSGHFTYLFYTSKSKLLISCSLHTHAHTCLLLLQSFPSHTKHPWTLSLQASIYPSANPISSPFKTYIEFDPCPLHLHLSPCPPTPGSSSPGWSLPACDPPTVYPQCVSQRNPSTSYTITLWLWTFQGFKETHSVSSFRAFPDLHHWFPKYPFGPPSTAFKSLTQCYS